MKSPRSGKKLTTHELARFLALLADTGNFALACDRLGRSRSGLYKRRARDPAFAAECVAAIAMFRLAPARPERSPGALKSTWNDIGLSTHAGRPQLRRLPSGCLTPAGIETFLKTLAATANIRFSAHSVGVAPSSISARARRDPAFARAMAEAIDTAKAALEMRVLELSRVLDDEGEGEGSNAIGELSVSEAIEFLRIHARRG